MKSKKDRFLEVVAHLIDIGQASSRDDLSKKAGLGQNTISRIETGKVRSVSDETVRKLADRFGDYFQTDYIRGFSDYMTVEAEIMARQFHEHTSVLDKSPGHPYPAAPELPPLMAAEDDPQPVLPVWADTLISIMSKQIKENEALNASLRQSLAEVSELKSHLSTLISELQNR